MTGRLLGKKKWKKRKIVLFHGWSRIKNFCSNLRIALGILFIFLLIWLFGPRLPSFLGIKSLSSANTVLAVIVGALGSLLGIIIAVILVAFEILRKTYTTYATKAFFQNERLRELFVLYVSTIIVSILTIASLSYPLDSRDVCRIYISLYLFIGSISVLFPYSKEIIASAQSKEKIRELVNQVDYWAVSSFSRFRPPVPPSTYIESMEDNPIFILSEVSVRTLKDDDRLIPNLVLVESTNKLLKMLDTASNKRETINAFLIIFRNTAQQAIHYRQEGILRTIMYSIEIVHNFCAEKRIPWHEVIELNEFLNDMLEESIKVGLNQTVEHGFWMIERLMKEHLDKNVPNEDEIWDLHIRTGKEVPVDHEKSLQWENVSTEYIRMISNLVEKSIELKCGEIVRTGLSSLIRIASEVIDSKLGDLQKADIVRLCYYYAKALTLKCVDENLYKKVLALSPFEFLRIEEALENEAEFSKIPLIEFSDFIIKLAKENSLDTFDLNELGSIGRSAIDKLGKNKKYKDALIFIIDVFDKLREITETDLTEEKKRIYLAISSQAESLKNWMKQHEKKDEEVQSKLNSVLSKFSKIEVLRREQEQNIVKWPEIAEKDEAK